MDNEKILQNTKSYCRHSGKLINAQIIKREDEVYIRRNCPEHGVSENLHIFSRYDLYENMDRIFCRNKTRKTYPHELVLYITTKCNMCCPVCYIDAGEDTSKEMYAEDVKEIIKNYQGRFVHISGGEPTLREDLFDIIKIIKDNGYLLGLFTNGIKLTEPDYVEKLKKNKVDLIILSLESLEDSDYEELKGKKLLEIKLQAIENIKKTGIALYLFCSVAEDVNYDQIPKLINYAKSNIDSIDILNFTPIWRIGRFGNLNRISATKIYEKLNESNLYFDDFIKCTEFSHLFFEIVSKLSNKQWVRQPPCEQLIYLIKAGNEIFKISELVDLPFLIDKFNSINIKITSKSFFLKWAYFLFKFPSLYFLKVLVTDNRMRKLSLAMIKDILSFKGIKRTISTRKLTIMTGQVHSFEDADSRFLEKCTLYASDKNGKNMLSFCIRQMQCEVSSNQNKNIKKVNK